jgi:poly(hydroxyalkanoate) depolymerase family esterase
MTKTAAPETGQVIVGTCTTDAGERSYSLHVPRSGSCEHLVVMLHGCLQPARDFAVATNMNGAAAARGWATLWPEQPTSANPMGCWNWFVPKHQSRDGGEAAILGAMIVEVCERQGIAPGHVMLAGISAGAAMASILAVTYPELISVLAMHSGTPFGAATDVIGGLTLMKTGDSDPVALGALAHRTMGSRARPIPAMVLQGGADKAVNPGNGTRAAQQWAVTNLLALGFVDQASRVPQPASETVHRESGRYDATVVRYQDDAGHTLAEEWRIPGLGHAWSGGSSEVSYTDPHGPDATAAMIDFFTQATGQFA